ncbi:hypothetical protein FLP10_03660 [Agromyces intestinalis]|uniref:Uncharacterized protein n=1 Tax=Agromyces intestinalis TaxID=2592652 RepID=A0A5C1YDB0_9MICO|nr:hypothetical protein [Agromyces intestinalis]QEO13618.1 hypothetical protein FLP10_03660 [Agromyces intestinalis]
MSHRQSHPATQPLAGRAMGMRGCEAHAECASDRPGHRLHRMQARLAEVAGSKWVDAIVISADADGFVELAELDGTSRRVWHHAPLGEVLVAGAPVALHTVYSVLDSGAGRLSIAEA